MVYTERGEYMTEPIVRWLNSRRKLGWDSTVDTSKNISYHSHQHIVIQVNVCYPYQFLSIYTPVLATEALVMWTARYGVLGSEEEETRPDIMSPKKDHLELEIHMNEIGHEDENNNKIDKRNQYKPYFTKRNHERSASSPKRHKIVTVHGDGRMSQKQVIRYANAQLTQYVHKY